MPEFLVLNGPNLNLLGAREPAHYGAQTLDGVNEKLAVVSKQTGVQLLTLQSNANTNSSTTSMPRRTRI